MRWLAAVALGLGLMVAPAHAADTIPVKGADASWPNCPKGMGIPSRKTLGLPMPKKEAKFVILGLTNGPGFYPNPCIQSQVDWAKKRGIWVGTYAMTTYPKPAQLRKHGTAGPWEPTSKLNRLRNAGYAQAQFNLATMDRVGLVKKFVWVDVEPYAVAPWTSNRTWNKAVLDGVLQGYDDAGVATGFYTSPGPWRDIIGTARYGLPEWRTAGGHPWSSTNYGSARRMCSVTNVQGGKTLVAQWWDTKRDYNLLCPQARDTQTVESIFTWMPLEES